MSANLNPAVEKIQQSIDDTVVLLVELRSRKTVTTKHQHEIDALVEELQSCSRALPRLATNRKGLKKKVFILIEQAISLWKDLFGE